MASPKSRLPPEADHVVPKSGQLSARPKRLTPPSGGWIIRRQVRCLISEILSDTTVDEDVRLGLFRHLAEYPGNPERALLAQVNDWQDREAGTAKVQLQDICDQDAEAGEFPAADPDRAPD